jgi:maleamate amidohydrolase
MASTKNTKASFRARGFNGRVGFGLRPAVIVVDLIEAFTNPVSPLAADLRPQLAATRKLLSAARKVKAPIIFTTVEYDPSLKDAGLFVRKARGLSWLVQGSRWVELDQALKRRRGELLIKKKYASAFFGTDLASLLATQGIDTVIVAGCTTSGCVRATVVDALQYGLHAIVPREAVGDRLASAHDASLFDIDMKYGDVVALQEVLNRLQHKPRSGKL